MLAAASLGLSAEQSPPAKRGNKQDTQKQTASKSADASKPAESSKSPAEPAEPPRVVYTPSKPKPPEGAVEIKPGLWRLVEKDGKVWHYRQTPFGLAKFDPNETPTESEEELIGVVAFDKGDSVEFQRKTPFGTTKWTKKKSEMTGPERNAFERSVKSAKE
jgi:hypothetical protein